MTLSSVLAIGSHPDDVELGVGATMLAHRASGHRTAILVMTEGEQSREFATTRRQREQESAAQALGAELYWGGFVDCEVPSDRRTIDRIEEVIALTQPDLIYVHAPDDAHQDHRTISAAAISAARRSSRILLYPTPSTMRFEPTVFVDVEDHIGGKLSALRCHESQVLAGSVQLDAIAASARHFGALARIGLAEAFVPLRFVWDVAKPAGLDDLDHQLEFHGAGLTHGRSEQHAAD